MNLNKVFLIGRLTQDPEARSTPNGQNVTTIKMATNRVWNDSTGQRQTAPEYHTVIAWGRIGEIASNYLKKGSMVMIEGRLQTRSWTGQDNLKRYMTEIIAENIQLGPRAMNPASSENSGTFGTPRVNDVQKPQVPDVDNIPIIDANEPTSSGVEEGEMKINEEDLPF